MVASYDPSTLTHPLDLLRFAQETLATGRGCALVAVTGTQGGGVRAPGALMVVTEAGKAAGYVSNGCVDADVIVNAQSAIGDGRARELVYGEGSPFLDIRLPCGGRLELIVLPLTSGAEIAKCVARLDGRQAVTLKLSQTGEFDYLPDDTGATEWRNDVYRIFCTPKLKLRIAGKGPEVLALADLAQTSGYECLIQSPETELLDRATLRGLACELLVTPDAPPRSTDDAWTAFVLMFHDHDWEAHLLKQALRGPAFYVGALGSRRTHDIRSQRLLGIGVPIGQVARIRAPIGVLPKMRTAPALAVSVLAEILQRQEEVAFETV